MKTRYMNSLLLLLVGDATVFAVVFPLLNSLRPLSRMLRLQRDVIRTLWSKLCSSHLPVTASHLFPPARWPRNLLCGRIVGRNGGWDMPWNGTCW